MLVPLVLRSIVLPYLRSAPSTSTTAVVVSATGRAFSTSTSRARAVEASLAQQTSEEPYRRPWPPTVLSNGELHRSRQPRLPREPSAPPLARPSLGADRREDISVLMSHPIKDRSRTSTSISEVDPTLLPLAQELPSVTTPSEPTRNLDKPREKTALSHSSKARPHVPPVIGKLLGAKLYRMAVFHMLSTPEYFADVRLVDHVVSRLEKNGAGKLARRLRMTFERNPDPTAEPSKPIRLWSEKREDTEKRPPTYWREPRVVRPMSEYHGTRSERLTHYLNHQLSNMLTRQHPAPYKTPLSRDMLGINPPAGLCHVRDIMLWIDKVRKHHGFVPDRVTANIIVKAWLQDLSRRRDWQRRPVQERKSDLRDIFALVALSLEEGAARGAGKGLRTPFDGEVDYARHVQPFVKSIIKAMVLISDHEGRIGVEKWALSMRQRLENSAKSSEMAEKEVSESVEK